MGGVTSLLTLVTVTSHYGAGNHNRSWCRTHSFPAALRAAATSGLRDQARPAAAGPRRRERGGTGSVAPARPAPHPSTLSHGSNMFKWLLLPLSPAWNPPRNQRRHARWLHSHQMAPRVIISAVLRQAGFRPGPAARATDRCDPKLWLARSENICSPRRLQVAWGGGGPGRRSIDISTLHLSRWSSCSCGAQLRLTRGSWQLVLPLQ